nr:MAG TPA: AAA ATPase [Caudoviricetes sp.]
MVYVIIISHTPFLPYFYFVYIYYFRVNNK